MLTRPRVATVLAHPDDETFGTGGTLIRCVARGAEVHSLCLTHGEEGWMGDPSAPLATRETVGEVRADEVRAAGRLMGLASVTVRDWGDSRLAEREARSVEDDILAWLRDHRPDVVITWGPEGGYQHPDHIAAGERCLAALERLDEPRPRKVYRFVLYAREWDAFQRYRKHFTEDWRTFFETGRVRLYSDAQISALLELTPAEHERKWQAMRLHRTQYPDLRNYETLLRLDPRALRWEAYLRHRPPPDGRLETDLLADL